MILSSPLLFSTPPPAPPAQHLNATPLPSPPPARSRRFTRRRCRRTGDSRWDSNAESFRFRFRDGEAEGGEFADSGGGGGGRRWWSDEPGDEFDDEFDPFGEDSESIWDKFWILKVFKAYGYLLPAIIASFLLSTGPKAFLMALALPLGQSAISLAIEKLWGKVADGPGRSPRKKRKPFTPSPSSFREQGKERSSGGRGRSSDYQSWASVDSGAANKVVSQGRRSSFGGWDDLDSENGSMRRESPTTSGSPKAEMPNRGKLSKAGRYRDAPLFLRLLISVFPFLGSWTKIL